MSYMRFAGSFVDGSPSWYIYADVNGKLCIMQPRGGNFLTYREVAELRDILTEALADNDEAARPMTATEQEISDELGEILG